MLAFGARGDEPRVVLFFTIQFDRRVWFPYVLIGSSSQELHSSSNDCIAHPARAKGERWQGARRRKGGCTSGRPGTCAGATPLSVHVPEHRPATVAPLPPARHSGATYCILVLCWFRPASAGASFSDFILRSRPYGALASGLSSSPEGKEGVQTAPWGRQLRVGRGPRCRVPRRGCTVLPGQASW